MDNPSPSVAQARAPSPLSFLLLTPTLSDSPTSFPLGADPESDHFLSQPNPYHLPLPLGSQRDLSHWPRCSCCGLSSMGDTTSRVKLPDQSTLTQTQSTQEPTLHGHTWSAPCHCSGLISLSPLRGVPQPQSFWLTLTAQEATSCIALLPA